MYDAASRSPSLTGPWTVVNEVKAESKKQKKKNPSLQGPRVVVESQRARERAGEGGRGRSTS